MMLDLIEIDHELAMKLITRWADDIVELSKNSTNMPNIDEYWYFRGVNSGLFLAQSICAFGTGVCLTKEEEEKLDPIIKPCLISTAVMNDFYSWPREIKYHIDRGLPDIPYNSTALFMRDTGCTEEEALIKVRIAYLGFQDEHLSLIRRLEQTEGTIPERHRKYINAAQYGASGGEYWSAFAARYPTKADLNQGESEYVNGVFRFKKVVADQDDQSQEETPALCAMASSDNRAKSSTDSSSHVALNESLLSTSSHIHHLDSDNTNGVEQAIGIDAKISQHHNNVEMITTSPSKNVVLAPYEYIESLPSTGFRNTFIDCLDWWMDASEQESSSIKEIVNMLHSASLMLDDIQDDSKLRRGQPSTHMLYGAPQTINSATYMIVKVFKEAQKFNNPALTSILIDELENLHYGQSPDLNWRHHLYIPSVEDYMMMVEHKTGGQLRLCVAMMQEVATKTDGQKLDFEHFTRLLGRYYQVRDDYKNLTSEEYTNKKGFCEDLDEGKISLPLIYCLSKSSENIRAQILGIFQLKGAEGLSLEMKNFVLEKMRECHALQYTKMLIQEMETDLLKELKKLEAEIGKRNSLLELALRTLWI